MKLKRRLTALLIFLALISACGTAATNSGSPAQPAAAPATGEQVTLSLWIFEGEEAFLPMLQEAFQAKYPNVTLEITQIPEDQYVTKIDTALAANDPPDIGFVYGGQQRWLKAGKFLPLDDMLSAQNIKLSDYNANAMSLYCDYDGKTYCIGSYTGAVLLFYNKDMFDAAGLPYPSATEPMTVDQYAELIRKLVKPSDDINQRVWGGSAHSTYWYADWANNFSPDGKQAQGFLNDQATVHTYDVMAQLVRDGVAPSSSDMQQIGDTNLLSQKKVAMEITDNIVAIPLLEAQNIRYGAAPPPVEQAGDKPFIITWTDAFGVFSQSEHPQEAKDFLAFLATEGNKQRLEATDVVPLNTSLATQLNWGAKNDGRKEVLQALGTARPTVFVPGFYAITGPIGDAFNLIVEGQSSATDAMNEAALQVQDGLDKAWTTWDQIK